MIAENRPNLSTFVARPAGGLAAALFLAALVLGLIAALAPDGGQDAATGQTTPTIEDWRGNSASIKPAR